MQRKFKILQSVLFLPLAFLLPKIASAHENYVLTKDQIAAGMSDFSINILTALKSPGNVRVALAVGLFSTLGVIIYFLFFISEAGQKMDIFLRKLEPLGHVIVRMALGVSLIFSAYTN